MTQVVNDGLIRENKTASVPGMPLVLMYHSIEPYQADPYLVTVSPPRFAQQMRWLDRRGLRGVSIRTCSPRARRAAGRAWSG